MLTLFEYLIFKVITWHCPYVKCYCNKKHFRPSYILKVRNTFRTKFKTLFLFQSIVWEQVLQNALNKNLKDLTPENLRPAQTNNNAQATIQ